jgi:hypothetical protein
MENAKLKPGMEIWLNCMVSDGPLSEHLVRFRVGDRKWLGFVKDSELSSDRKRVRAVILDLKNGIVTIGIRGHSPTSDNPIKTNREQISGISAVA